MFFFDTLMYLLSYTADLVIALKTLGLPLLIFYFFIYPVTFHPLASVPGPIICKLTKYYVLYRSWKGERNRWVESLHEKYGTIVRIGPTEIDINDASYLKDIYMANFDKSTFYSNFKFYGCDNSFSKITKKEHLESKRVSHKFFSKSSVFSEGIMLKLNVVLSGTLRLLNEYNGKPIDSFIVFREMAMDIVTSFSFGLKNYDSLLKDPFGKSVDLLKDFETQASTGFWITQMPLFSSLTNSQNVKEASSRCLNWVENQFNLSLSNLKSINDGSLMTVYFEENNSGGTHIKKPGLFDKVHAKSEIYDVVAAGHVTAAVMLSYVCYELAAHPQIQEKVREELYQQLRYDSSIFCTDFTPFDYKLVDNEETLPYFHAVINETFRVNTPGPGQQPRVVPESGLIWRGSQNVSPFKIPGGTVVVTQSWSLHRAKNVFPNPYKFIPERWMNIPNSQLRFLKSHLHHFGSGARGCMGMNLANAEIKMMLSSLICRYRIELVAGVDYVHDAEMIDAYVSAPKSGRMVLKFTNIN